MTWITNIEGVKSVTGLNDKVEERRMLPFLDSVHKTVKRLLGTTLYDRLITEIEADSTLAGEADLLELRDDYIKPFIAWETYARSFSRLYAEFDRNGAHYKNDANTVQAGSEWMKQEAASARDQANEYQEELLDFLKDNSGDGEPFEDYNTTTDDEAGERIGRTDHGGVYMPRRTPRRVWR